MSGATDAILQRLTALHPKVIDLSLDRMRRLLADLGDPQDRIPPVVHVAGTNGKGSTQAYIRAGLEAAGLRVHAYTSPHLAQFRERIRLAGTLIEDDALADLLAQVEAANDGQPITFFEITTAAAFLAFTIFFYAVVYTMWLKRSTPQNIVIGGAAGAFPPMIGWACATGGLSIEPLLMFALIFFWTPPHFWALALFMKEDYHNAGVPMLTVTHGREATRRHVFGYTLVLAPFAVAIGLTSVGGPVYMAVALVLNALFIRGGWQILRRTEEQAQADGYRAEKGFFRLSLYYLALHFAALAVQATLGTW